LNTLIEQCAQDFENQNGHVLFLPILKANQKKEQQEMREPNHMREGPAERGPFAKWV